MTISCCSLVGNFFNETSFTFDSYGCFISVNNNINTEYNDYGCSTMIGGYTVGSLNIAGFAGTDIYKGCPGNANVQVLWLRKYDCSMDLLHFIYAGEGRSSMSGDASNYVSLNKTYPKNTRMISASAQSGPNSLYSDVEQIEGIGMLYSKGPITFDTSYESGCVLPNMGVGNGDYYLQNFRIELVPGSIPIANYTFAYNP